MNLSNVFQAVISLLIISIMIASTYLLIKGQAELENLKIVFSICSVIVAVQFAVELIKDHKAYKF